MRRAVFAVGLLLILAGAGAGVWAYTQFDAPGPLSQAANEVVPHGGLADVSATLAKDGVIARPLLFRLFAAVTARHGALHAGEFAFPAAATPGQVLAILRTARQVQHHVTIPEGLTGQQVAKLLDAADALTGDAPIPAEGSILPQTYSYERGTTREQVLDRARQAMERALDAAWEQRSPGLRLDNKRQALILASMVERETALPEERPMVAAVFLNRLASGMKLQSDPTVIYGATGGAGMQDHPITRAELEQDTPYNTYRIPGLPAGPICMPGLASLRAATQPATTDMLYFVANGTGGHSFAHSQGDHLRNVARWREIERARASGRNPG